ncbi:hypothetical protein ACIGD1_32635 [Streptomyces sp. NPDC085612]|uniref:hypothetical protein n=1 Tax=Streptomyces sp. NPDC085612 TaxID=3365732 RepID=UPI0037D28B2A
MLDPELLERITARRAELDELEEQLAKHLAEVGAERTNSPSLNVSSNGWLSSSPRNEPRPHPRLGRASDAQ